MNAAIAICVAYLLGSIPFGLLLVRWRTGRDVRAAGSGNIGATNVLRTSGKALGIATLLLDTAKGSAAVVLAQWLTGDDSVAMAASAVAVLCGHMFPVWLGFKGGKAVASALGAFLVLTPWAMLATGIIFVALCWKTRIVSLSSIAAAAVLPLGVWLLTHSWIYLTAATIAAVLVIYKHKSNIARLRAGTESRLGSNA
jgi:glycerol-3-phosphate acyltransferase PlsY